MYIDVLSVVLLRVAGSRRPRGHSRWLSIPYMGCGVAMPNAFNQPKLKLDYTRRSGRDCQLTPPGFCGAWYDSWYDYEWDTGLPK